MPRPKSLASQDLLATSSPCAGGPVVTNRLTERVEANRLIKTAGSFWPRDRAEMPYRITGLRAPNGV